MESKQKSSWGSVKDWTVVIGVMIAVIGLLVLVSSFMPVPATAPDEVVPAVGFFGMNATMPGVILLVVGLVVAGVGQFVLKKPQA